MSSPNDQPPFEFEKQPDEKEYIGIDFSRRVPTGVTIASYTATAELYNADPTALANSGLTDHLEVSNVSLNKKTVLCLISKGVDSFKYRVTFRAILSDTQEKEDEIFVSIIEK